MVGKYKKLELTVLIKILLIIPGKVRKKELRGGKKKKKKIGGL